MNGRLLGFVCLLSVPWTAPALAWGDLAHRIVCEIAFQELNAPVRGRVKALIRKDPEFSTFAQACTWADWPRRRAMEHFVNLPRDAAGFGGDPCPTADECVVTAIEKDLAVLSSSSATEQERLEALKYLGHWVGDVHQPLHVSFEDDRGGNGVGVSGGLCRSNLHAAWDGCLLQQDLEGDARSIARDLLDKVTDKDRAAWSSSTPIEWANESFLIAISPEVRYCIRTETGCWYSERNERLEEGDSRRTVRVDQAYIETHGPTVREQLVKAGIRLGGVLNQALGD